MTCHIVVERIDMKTKIIRPFILLSLISVVLFVGYFLFFYMSTHGLRIDTYDIPAAVQEPVRIVQLSDLHNSEFGSENSRLVDTVARQEPDLIFLTGDLINDDDPNLDIALNLIKDLSQIAPVYASYGNHELTYEETFHVDLAQAYERAGATFLDLSWEDVTVDHTTLRIGGVYSYCLPPEYGAASQKVCDYLDTFQKTQLPTLLLCHLPVYWPSISLNYWDVDIIFSGHLHGGQVVLPGIGGLYAPDMGWFPGQLHGIYWSQDNEHALVLSSGLGSGEQWPRINNIPQIMVVNLITKGQ